MVPFYILSAAYCHRGLAERVGLDFPTSHQHSTQGRAHLLLQARLSQATRGGYNPFNLSSHAHPWSATWVRMLTSAPKLETLNSSVYIVKIKMNYEIATLKEKEG